MTFAPFPFRKKTQHSSKTGEGTGLDLADAREKDEDADPYLRYVSDDLPTTTG